MRRNGRLVRGLVVGLVAGTLLLLLAELSVRVVGRLRDGAWPRTRAVAFHERILQLRHIYRSHAYLNTGPREGGAVDAFGRRVAVNQFGYRSPERPLAKPEGVVRVLIAGGSTTFDLLAPDDATAWPGLVEARLRRGGDAIEVWNAGFPGWTSQESVIALAIRDLDLAPDLAVLYQGVNDLQPASHQPFDPQYEHGHAEVTRRALGLELPPRPPLDRSLLAQWLRDLILDPTDPWQELEASTPPSGRRERIAEDGIATFERNVRSFAALARSRQAGVLLATQPLRIREAQRQADLDYLAGWYPGLAPESAPSEMERLNDVLRALTAAGVGELVDVAREIAWSDQDFGDPFHYAPSGREKLADYLASRIEATLSRRVGTPAEP